MTIPDSVIVAGFGGVAAAYGAALHYLKRRADDCERDRAGLHQKLTTTLTYLAELCGKAGIDFDPEKTPDPHSTNHKAYQIFRRMEKHVEGER